METLALDVELRDLTGKKVKNLREAGVIPGVIYGQKKDNMNISVPENVFSKLYRKAGENTVVILTVKGKEEPVLIYRVKRDPVSDRVIHIDFYRVNMTEKIQTTIPFNFIGVSNAVKNMGGTLITSKSEFEVKCLPTDLVSEIQVDISILETFNESIHIKDLNIPSGMEVLDDLEIMVAQVIPPRTEEEMEAELETPETEVIEAQEGEEKEDEDQEAGEAVEADGEQKEDS